MKPESQYDLNVLEYIREQRQIHQHLVDEMDIVALLGRKFACPEGMAFVLDNKCRSMEHAWRVCDNYHHLYWMVRRLITIRYRWVWLAACCEVNRQMAGTPFKDDDFESPSSFFSTIHGLEDGLVWLKRLPNPMTLYPMRNELRDLMTDFHDLYTATDTRHSDQFAVLLHQIFACSDARSWVLSNNIISAGEAWKKTNNDNWLKWMLRWMLPKELGTELIRKWDRCDDKSITTVDQIRNIIPNPFENGWDMIPSLAGVYVSHLKDILG